MKKDIVTMKASGMPLGEIGPSLSLARFVPSLVRLTMSPSLPIAEDILLSTNVQGFPVVRNEHDTTVLGYIRRAELRFAVGQSSVSAFPSPFLSFPRPHPPIELTNTLIFILITTEKARRQRHLTPTATCTFNMLDGVQMHHHSHPPEGHPLGDGGGDDAWGFDADGEHDDAELFEAAEHGRGGLGVEGGGAGFADFGPFVDQVSGLLGFPSGLRMLTSPYD